MTLPTLTALGATHGFTAGDIDSDGHVMMVPAFQKVYVADGVAGHFWKIDFLNTKLTGTPSGVFSRGETLTQATSGAKGIFDETVGTTHFVYRTTTVEFDTSNVITGAVSAKTLTPSAVQAPPHWLAWNSRQLSDPAGAIGTIADAADYMPRASNIGCLFNGRIFINTMDNPNQWIASRHRDPCDWKTNQDDEGTPVSSQTSKLGEVGDAIVAMIPFLDHYLIFGCANEVWVLRGDPGSGAQITNSSRAVGIFGPHSWTFDDKGNLFFMAMDGFYRLAAGAAVNQTPPENLTNTRVPNLVKSIGLNRRTDRVCMAYDKDRYGINVHISQMDSAYGVAFFWDLRLNAMYPDSMLTNQLAASMLYYNSRKAETRGLLLGCQDGYIRTYSDTEHNDDGSVAIDSFVTLGPFQAFQRNQMRGRSSEVGQIVEMGLRLGDDTHGVNLSVYGGDAAESVVSAVKAGSTPNASETIAGGGCRPTVRPRTKGSVFCVKVRNNTVSQRFALERITARINEAGKTKA